MSVNIIQKYGIYLQPSFYEHLNSKPMYREEAWQWRKNLRGTYENKVRQFCLTKEKLSKTGM